MHGESRTTNASPLPPPVAPLAATLGRASAVDLGGIDPGARLGVPDEPGWLSTAELIRDEALLAGILTRTGRGYGTDNRAYVGTALLRLYLWRILAPAVTAFLSERRLPDLRAENVAMCPSESGFAAGLAFAGPRFVALPIDSESDYPDAVVLPSEDALLAWLREALAQTHLSVLIPALRGLRVRRGMRAMWGVAADVCAEAFMLVGGKLECQAEACGYAERMLSGPGPLSGPTGYFAVESGGASELTRTRNTCCLYFKLGNGTCFTCPRNTPDERRRRLAERL